MILDAEISKLSGTPLEFNINLKSLEDHFNTTLKEMSLL